MPLVPSTVAGLRSRTSDAPVGRMKSSARFQEPRSFETLTREMSSRDVIWDGFLYVITRVG
jgi:hypothetical protein